jgi:hypothetical protein
MAKIHTIDGVQYREVARQAKVGDAFLKVTKAWSPFFTEGKVYPIVKVEFSSPYVVDEDGDLTALHDSKYVVLEPVAADLPALESELAAIKAKVAEMERQLAEVKKGAPEDRLKVGDYAVVLKCPGRLEIGDVVEVTYEDPYGGFDYSARRVYDGRSEVFGADELRRATDEEVAEAKRKLIQPGVYVKLQIPEGSRPRYGWGDAKNGDIGKVASRDGDEVRVDFPAQSGWKALIHELVLATEEERKKAEAADKWAAIGRKPGEFKVGDVVRIDSHNFVGKVEDVGDALLGIRDYGGRYRGIEKDEVELIAPVESVVNLRGGDVA